MIVLVIPLLWLSLNNATKSPGSADTETTSPGLEFCC